MLRWVMADQSSRPARHPTSATVDGLEGQHARVELANGTVEVWPRSELPHDVQEGDVLHVRVRDGERHVRIDRTETRRRHQQAQAELSELNAGSPKGELDL